MAKIFGSLLLSLSLLTLLFLYQKPPFMGLKAFSFFAQDSECVQSTPSELLIKMIENDFSELQRSHQLPGQWFALSRVEFKIQSELARALLSGARPSIKVLPAGTHYLEILMLDLQDENNPGIIIQASLFETKSKNKIFELGRTYTMKELNHR